MNSSDQSATSEPRAYRFGDFELRPDSHELIRAGAPVTVQPKVFDFITYLLLNRDRLVDKNELLDAVWPRQVVTEAALSRCVMKARRALDDDADKPRAILTVHGRGFRFLAAVEVATVDSTSKTTGEGPTRPTQPAESSGDRDSPAPQGAPRDEARRTPASGKPPVRGVPYLGWGIALLVLMIIAPTAWLLLRESTPSVRSDLPMRVAVLPMINETGDPRYDWARLGLMTAVDEILRVEGPAYVMGAHDVMELLAQTPTDEGVAERLREAYGITHIMRGTIHRNPAQLRLDYGVVDAAGAVRKRSVVAPDIQGLAHAAGADLRITLGLRGAAARISGDTFANEAYLRGRALSLQGDVKGAQEYYALASEQAPAAFWPRYEFALGLRDLGEREDAQARLEALSKEADADQDLPERMAVRNALAIMAWRSGDRDTAAKLLDEARVMAEQLGDPQRMAAILINLGILARIRDDLDGARDYLNKAASTELAMGQAKPSGNVSHSLANVELEAGDLGMAAHHLEDALDRFRLVGDRRNEAITLNTLGHLRWRQARYAESRDLYQQALERHRLLGNRSSEASALIGLADANVGLGHLILAESQAEQALSMAQSLDEKPKMADALAVLGRVARDRGNYEGARQWHEKALADLQSIDDAEAVWSERLSLARLDVLQGRFAEADEQAATMLAQAKKDASQTRERDAVLLAAEVALASARASRAIDGLEAASGLFAGDTDPDRKARASLILARALLAGGRLQEASEALAGAADLLGKTADFLRTRAEIEARRGELQLAVQSEEAAKAAAGEAWSREDERRLQARRGASN